MSNDISNDGLLFLLFTYAGVSNNLENIQKISYLDKIKLVFDNMLFICE